ncbi:MAG: ABC transporter substrate-binding protein [Elusimicrobia bacterium]|nr:ABC transporter substrate-binding protein [Elusimicrobiota bacterium]
MKKRLLAITAILSLGAGTGSATTHPDTFTYATISDADTLDPAWAYDTASHSIMLNIYEPLFFFDKSSTEKLVPLTAAKIPTRENGGISADGKVYRIPIRKGVKFHDGTPMTPEDVRYSIIRFLLLDRAAGPSSLLLEPILGTPTTRDEKGALKPDIFKAAEKAVRVEGDVLVLTLPQPYAPLLSILASWGPVLSKAWAVKRGDWDGAEASLPALNNLKKESSAFFESSNGTGPFKLERWDRKTKEVILARNDGYWKGPAKLKRVIIKGINEVGTRKLMLQAGDVDSVYADRSVYSQFQNLPGVQILDGQATMEINPIAFFTFQVSAAGNPYLGSGKLDGQGIPADFFSDIDVRKGFAYAFDYDGYIKDVFGGKGVRARGAIPKSLPGYNPKQAIYSLDLGKAKEHFQKAWGGKVWSEGFRFTLVFNSGNSARQNLCQIMKRMIESVNPKFTVDVRAVEWPTFLDAITSSKLPIFVMGWNADYPDPHNFAFPLLHTHGDFPGRQKFSNPEFDKIIEAANRETNLAKRKQLYAKLQQLEYEFVPHMVFVEQYRYRTQRNWVKGWYHNPVFPDSPYGGYYYPISKQ